MKIYPRHNVTRFVVGLMWLAATATAGQKTDQPVAGQKRRDKPGREIHWSSDHRLQAIVIALKPRSSGNAESQIEIRTVSGRLLARSDYSSYDGAHGGGVYGAAWTANSRFFVYITESSGGHSPWHHPTFFYSRRRRKIYSLDNTLGRLQRRHGRGWGDGAITADLELIKPCTIKTRARANVNVDGIKTRVPKRANSPDRSFGNDLTIDLARLESVLTRRDEDPHSVKTP